MQPEICSTRSKGAITSIYFINRTLLLPPSLSLPKPFENPTTETHFLYISPSQQPTLPCSRSQNTPLQISPDYKFPATQAFNTTAFLPYQSYCSNLNHHPWARIYSIFTKLSNTSASTFPSTIILDCSLIRSDIS